MTTARITTAPRAMRIPSEGLKVVLFDEIHQEFNGDEGNDERHDGPQQQSENFRSRESAVLQYELDDFYKTRAEHDGNGEKKGEFRGGGAGRRPRAARRGWLQPEAARMPGIRDSSLKRADESAPSSNRFRPSY